MTPTSVTNILRQFNEWSKGDRNYLPYSEVVIGEAIDTAVEMIDQQDRIFDVIERTWYKQGLDIRGASLSYFMEEVRSALEDSK